MDLPLFDTVHGPFVLTSTLELSDFEDRMNALRQDHDRYVAILRGERMQDSASLFQEVAAALQFPYYFGSNWNALDECIQDLEWLPATKFVIGITNSEAILANESEDDRRSFVTLLKEAGEAWSRPSDEDKAWGRPGRPFHVVLQCSDEKALAGFGINS